MSDAPVSSAPVSYAAAWYAPAWYAPVSAETGAGVPGRSSGTDVTIATRAGNDTTATAQNAARQPNCSPSSAPAGTPTTQATVTPPTTTDVARARAAGSTIAIAATRATAQNPAFASAPTTRVASSTS